MGKCHVKIKQLPLLETLRGYNDSRNIFWTEKPDERDKKSTDNKNMTTNDNVCNEKCGSSYNTSGC